MKFATFVFALLIVGRAAGDLVISEFMASNGATIQDEDGAFSDWLEIHNTGPASVNLGGLSLTDNADEPNKWTFPSLNIPAGGYQLVFASSKNRGDPGSELHTNFALGAGGEYLGLLDGSSILYEYSPSFPAQTADRSYGIDANGDVRFFSNPTPGGANGVGDDPVAAIATASVERGFYSSPFSVELTTTEPDAQIRYTTDGSEPTASTGTAYGSPIAIATTTILRAATFADGLFPSPTITHSYIFLNDVISQPFEIDGFPNGAQREIGDGSPVALDMEMDPAVVTAYSDEIIGAMTSIPTLSLSGNIDDIFGDNGFYWFDDVEKKMSLELLYGDGKPSEQIDCGTESHSHDRLKRSMKVNFRADYGTREWVTSFLQNAPLNGDSVTDTFRTLVLRGGNERCWCRDTLPDDTTYTIDQLYRDTQIAMGGVGSHGTFAHVYLNGVYWGLYNVVERADDEYMSEYFGGDDESWFFTNAGGGFRDSTRFDYLVEVLASRDMSDPTNYAEVQEYVDVTNFADYVLLNFWLGMGGGWPRQNWYFANRNDIDPLGPTPGIFIAWDGERSFPAEIQNQLASPGDDNEIPRIWHALRGSSEFTSLFSDRVALHTGPGGALSDEKVLERWNTLNSFVESAIIGESARWGDGLEDGVTRTRDGTWQGAVDYYTTILANNREELINLLVDAGFYSDDFLDPPTFDPGEGDVPVGTSVTIDNPNGVGSVVYTLDGSDPRSAGNPAVLNYSGSIAITKSLVISAAVIDGTRSSLVATSTYRVPSLAVTEVSYNPSSPTQTEIDAGFGDKDMFEFIELQNVSEDPLDIAGLSFTAGITTTALESQIIAPGGIFVLVFNPSAFVLRYGDSPLIGGTYTGNLANGGEQIVGEFDNVVFVDFTYDDVTPWPVSADGGGDSLHVVDLAGDLNDPSNWMAAPVSPGNVGSGPVPPPTTSTTPPTEAPNTAPVTSPVTPPTPAPVPPPTPAPVTGPVPVPLPTEPPTATPTDNPVPLPTEPPNAAPSASLPTAAPMAAQSVTFDLINAETNTVIGPLTNGMTINFATTGTSLNIAAMPASSVTSVGSVVFTYDGENFRTENKAPYALAGNSKSAYKSWTPSVGGHSLTATLYTETGGAGTEIASASVDFNVVLSGPSPIAPPTTAPILASTEAPVGSAPVTAQPVPASTPAPVALPTATTAPVTPQPVPEPTEAPVNSAPVTTLPVPEPTEAPLAPTPPISVGVVGFVLIDVGSGEMLLDIPLAPSVGVINIAAEGGGPFSIVATAAGDVGSVKFGFNADSDARTENKAPFALCGDSSNSYNACTDLVAGTHTVTATAYSEKNAGGTEYNAISATFTLQ